MPSVKFKNKTITLQAKESVLEGLEKQDQAIPNSCRSGVCQSCMMHAVSGNLPSLSQQGLKETLIQQNYFLACRCFPEHDLEVALPSDAALTVSATVVDKQPLTKDVISLRLQTNEAFPCFPGQYINLVKDDLIRSYSVANLCDVDGFMELHIQRMPEGKMSNWVHDTLAINEQLSIRGPAGNCFYSAGKEQDYPLLLAGTGTGLAPLEGVARTALHKNHQGNITLIHGAASRSGIYHERELSELADLNPSFTYRQSIRDEPDAESNDLFAMVKSRLTSLDLTKVHVYLCGAPELVNKLKMQVFLQGVTSAHIFSDPFITASQPAS